MYVALNKMRNYVQRTEDGCMRCRAILLLVRKDGVQFTVEQAMSAQTGNRGTALLGASRQLRQLYPGNTPAPTVTEPGWAPGPVRTGAENLSPPPPRSGYDPRTVKPVTSRSTDYDIPAQGRIEERRKQGTENFVQ